MVLYLTFSICVLSLIVSTTTAFTVLPTATRETSLSKLHLMTKEDTDALFKKANAVVDSTSCTKEDVDELVTTLQLQQKELYQKIDQMKNMVNKLQTMNAAENDSRKVDEVRETIRALYRVFQLDDKASGNYYPSLSRPTGWSGEINDGP